MTGLLIPLIVRGMKDPLKRLTYQNTASANAKMGASATNGAYCTDLSIDQVASDTNLTIDAPPYGNTGGKSHRRKKKITGSFNRLVECFLSF